MIKFILFYIDMAESTKMRGIRIAIDVRHDHESVLLSSSTNTQYREEEPSQTVWVTLEVED